MPVSPYAVASLIFEGVTVSGTLAQRVARVLEGCEAVRRGEERATVRALAKAARVVRR
jgi:hypothetical protein